MWKSVEAYLVLQLHMMELSDSLLHEIGEFGSCQFRIGRAVLRIGAMRLRA